MSTGDAELIGNLLAEVADRDRRIQALERQSVDNGEQAGAAPGEHPAHAQGAVEAATARSMTT